MFDFFNAWDIVVGVLSLGGTFLVAYLYHQLPSKRILVLLALLEDTIAHFTSCIEQGLLHAQSVADFEVNFATLREVTTKVESETRQARTWTEDVSNLFKGLSRKINSVCHDVREVGAAVSTASLLERKRLDAERCAAATVVTTANATANITTNTIPDDIREQVQDGSSLPPPDHTTTPVQHGSGCSAGVTLLVAMVSAPTTSDFTPASMSSVREPQAVRLKA